MKYLSTPRAAEKNTVHTALSSARVAAWHFCSVHAPTLQPRLPEVNLPNAMLSPWHLDGAGLRQQNTATSRWPAALHTASLISSSKPIQHENIALAQSQSHYLPLLTLTLLRIQLSRKSGRDQTCWPTRGIFVGWVPSRGCLIRLSMHREIHAPFSKRNLHSSLSLRCRSQSSTRN